VADTTGTSFSLLPSLDAREIIRETDEAIRECGRALIAATAERRSFKGRGDTSPENKAQT
jgi:hypothetical protein